MLRPETRYATFKKIYPGSSNSVWVAFAETFGICCWVMQMYRQLYDHDNTPGSIAELIFETACFGMITALVMSVDGLYNHKKVSVNQEPPLDPSFSPLQTLLLSFASILGSTLYFEQFRTGQEISDKGAWRNAVIWAFIANALINIPGYWTQITYGGSAVLGAIKSAGSCLFSPCNKENDLEAGGGHQRPSENSSLVRNSK